MQICDAPDATGHLFHPLLRLDVGGEEARPSGRERDLKHGGVFSQQPAVCWCYGGNASDYPIMHFGLIPGDGQKAAAVQAWRVCSGREPPKLTLICRIRSGHVVKPTS